MPRTILTDRETRSISELFVLGRKLGQGAFGTVYEVHEKANPEKKYACKSLSKSKIKRPDQEEEVRKEIQIMEKLADYRCVVQFVEAFEDRANVYIVMELCTGGELFDRIIAKGHYSESDAADAIRTMLKVVSGCHKNDIIHRDLKPENFLLDSTSDNAELKATDFGLSVISKRGEFINEQVGTPIYVAPEVLRGLYNHKADIWSLGVILYILLSGRPPFYGRTDQEELRSTLKGEYSLENDPWPEISEEAKDVVRKMLTMDFNARPEAEELLIHPWVKKYGVASSKPLVESVRTSMKQFAEMNKLKKRALQYMASNLSESEMEELKQLFQKMDTDGSGSISVEEFKSAMVATGYEFSDSEVVELLAAYDVDDSGSIDYSEFCSAMTSINRLNNVENLELAFSKFDTDGDGSITVSEVVEALKDVPGIDQAAAEKLIAEADKDGDGRIDYDEFVSMMVIDDKEYHSATEMQKGRLSVYGLQA